MARDEQYRWVRDQRRRRVDDLRMLLEAEGGTIEWDDGYIVSGGDPIPGEVVWELAETHIDESTSTLAALLGLAHGGTISIIDWQTAVAFELRELTSEMYLLGIGGWGQMTPEGWESLEERLTDIFGAIDELGGTLSGGELTLAQAMGGLRRLVGRVWSAFWDGQTKYAEGRGAAWEERVLDPGARHCASCVAYADMGRVPVGTLPMPGEESECGPYCRCTILYYDAEGEQLE